MTGNRIVQAFNNIVDVLIEQVNFTNIYVVQRDLALRGERVSYLQELCVDIILVCVSYRLTGVHFKAELSQ